MSTPSIRNPRKKYNELPNVEITAPLANPVQPVQYIFPFIWKTCVENLSQVGWWPLTPMAPRLETPTPMLLLEFFGREHLDGEAAAIIPRRQIATKIEPTHSFGKW